MSGSEIKPFILINDYLNFVFAYLVGFALLFQIPLVMLFINRIKPQSPRRLMGHQRWVILASFVLAAILTPTPDPFNQTLMAAPMIVLYQVGVSAVWWQHRRRHRKDQRSSEAAPVRNAEAPPVASAPPLDRDLNAATTSTSSHRTRRHRRRSPHRAVRVPCSRSLAASARRGRFVHMRRAWGAIRDAVCRITAVSTPAASRGLPRSPNETHCASSPSSSKTAAPDFVLALGELRGAFGVSLKQLVSIYDIEIHGELASLLPRSGDD